MPATNGVCLDFDWRPQGERNVLSLREVVGVDAIDLSLELAELEALSRLSPLLVLSHRRAGESVSVILLRYPVQALVDPRGEGGLRGSLEVPMAIGAGEIEVGITSLGDLPGRYRVRLQKTAPFWTCRECGRRPSSDGPVRALRHYLLSAPGGGELIETALCNCCAKRR